MTLFDCQWLISLPSVWTGNFSPRPDIHTSEWINECEYSRRRADTSIARVMVAAPVCDSLLIQQTSRHRLDQSPRRDKMAVRVCLAFTLSTNYPTPSH